MGFVLGLEHRHFSYSTQLGDERRVDRALVDLIIPLSMTSPTSNLMPWPIA